MGSAHALGAMALGVWLGRLSEGVAGFVVGQGLVLGSLLILVDFQAIPVLLASFFLRERSTLALLLHWRRRGRQQARPLVVSPMVCSTLL